MKQLKSIVRRSFLAVAAIALMFVLSATPAWAVGSANLFIDWTPGYHQPSAQACNYIPITPGVSTVLDLMLDSSGNCHPSEPPISFVCSSTESACEKTGFLTAIDGVAGNQNDNGRYWCYYVNGALAPVAFNSYVLQDGDSVAWDYLPASNGCPASLDSEST